MLPTELYGDFQKAFFFEKHQTLPSKKLVLFMDWLVKMFSQKNVRELKIVGFCLPYQDQA